MRVAIIDLGTNTFNLLICDKKGESQKTIFKNKIAVKLGEGGIDKGIIDQAPYQRGIKALEDHLNTIKEYDVDKVRAFATSAIRSTKNGADFVSEVFEKLALKIEVIDGDKEAELIYQGVRKAIQFDLDYKLIMDIGGGSTETGWLTYLDATTTTYVNTSDVGNTTGFMGTLIYYTDA